MLSCLKKGKNICKFELKAKHAPQFTQVTEDTVGSARKKTDGKTVKHQQGFGP